MRFFLNSIYFLYIPLRKTTEAMKTISLKIDEVIFDETETILESLNKPRNRYINEAIEFYNKVNRKTLLAKKLKLESKLVAENSMNVLRDFEGIDYEN